MNPSCTIVSLRRTAQLGTLTLGLLAGPGGLWAQPVATLTPAAERISDQAIAADQQTYEKTQARLQALNAAGRPLRDYHLSKAQCWLDVSMHEYTRNDRSAFPQAALGEADHLAAAMEARRTPLPMDTPLVNDAARLRPDLWARAEGLRTHAGWACAQAQAACAEVELVHAGNEIRQQQWRHAQPYVQIAEDLLARADRAAQACPSAALPPLAAAPVPTSPVSAAPTPAPAPAVDFSASVVFNFDRFEAADIRDFSRANLQRLAAQVLDKKLRLDSVQLVGHADRLNSTGQRDYNEQLSRKRAQTVRQVLVELGFAADRIAYEYVGDRQQVVACASKPRSTAELEECLLPNRRVEVRVRAQPQ